MPLHLPIEIGDGLVLRIALTGDAEALADFNNTIHADNWLSPWIHFVLAGAHPVVRADDILLVENTRSPGSIAATASLIRQTWAYESIPFGVGQLEGFGTHPAYRRRGFARAILQVLEQKSSGKGDLVNAILGIPWFYRQFGYEYALATPGTRQFSLENAGKLPGHGQSFSVRPAQVEDISRLMRMTGMQNRRFALSSVADENHWHYQLRTACLESITSTKVFVFCAASGEMRGYFRTSPRIENGSLRIQEFFVLDEVEYRSLFSLALKTLKDLAHSLPQWDHSTCTHLLIDGEQDHPLFQALDAWLEAFVPPYAWYLKVPDLPAFLMHIRPALEKRLQESDLQGYTGDLCLSFYTSGVRLQFQHGRLEGTQPASAEEAQAAFPGQTFLKLFFCYRSLTELRHTFPDCWAEPEAARLLDVLFPRRPSLIQMMA